MSARARAIPAPPEGDQGWKEPRYGTFVRIVRRGPKIITARVTPTSKGAAWAYMHVAPWRGPISDVWLNCAASSIDEAMRACDRVFKARKI